MVRGFGEVELAAEAPTVLVVLAALITQLGDVWFLFALPGLCYWFGETLPGPLSFDQPTAAFLITLGLGAKALTTTLKQWLAYPRPPERPSPPTSSPRCSTRGRSPPRPPPGSASRADTPPAPSWSTAASRWW